MHKQVIYAIVHGKLSISLLSADEVRRFYPGISSVKPLTYFGSPFNQIIERYNLSNKDDYIGWFHRFKHAYFHYWQEPMGRMHLYEPTSNTLKCGNSQRIIKSLSFFPTTVKPKNGLIQLSFEISPVEIFRRVMNMQRVMGGLEFSQDLPDNYAAHFYLIDNSVIPFDDWNALDIHRRSDEDGVWLSRYEVQQMNISFKYCKKIAFSRRCAVESVVSKRFSIAPWEELSQSIAAAHLARLSGELFYWNQQPSLNGLLLAGAVRTIMYERFKPIFRCLPSDCDFNFGIGSLTCNVDSAYLNDVIYSAYQSNLMPTRSVEDFKIDFPRTESIFDAMFESNIKGLTAELSKWDEKALVKGGIYAH